MDCASTKAWGNFGCEGGFVEYGLAYAATYALEEEATYGYQEEHHECRFDYKLGRVEVNEYWEIIGRDVNQLKAALAMGPVGVAVDADSNVFRNY